jgi:hypothetical protein
MVLFYMRKTVKKNDKQLLITDSIHDQLLSNFVDVGLTYLKSQIEIAVLKMAPLVPMYIGEKPIYTIYIKDLDNNDSAIYDCSGYYLSAYSFKYPTRSFISMGGIQFSEGIEILENIRKREI